MVRHVVGYANFSAEDILRTGLSKLLTYPEFSDAACLAKSLSLLEDENQMREILRECCKKNEMTSWITDDRAIISIPYRINQVTAGAIALLGPMRVPYRNLFGLMQLFSEQIGRALTDSVYKYKISFRQPVNQSLIEDKTT
jgi:heat-inducible transcriptional repressor